MKTGALIIASGDYGEMQQVNEGIPVFLPMYPLDGTNWLINGELQNCGRQRFRPYWYWQDATVRHCNCI